MGHTKVPYKLTVIGPFELCGLSQETETAAFEIADAWIRGGADDGTEKDQILQKTNPLWLLLLHPHAFL